MEPVTLNKRLRNQDSVDFKTSNKVHWKSWVKIGENFNIIEADAGDKISDFPISELCSERKSYPLDMDDLDWLTLHFAYRQTDLVPLAELHT